MSYLVEYYMLVVMNIACWIWMGYLIHKLTQRVSDSHRSVDLELIAQSIVAQAVWDFQTDKIHHDSLDPYVRAKFLDFCSKTGLSPEFMDVVLNSARRLIPQDTDLEVEGIADFDLMNL